MKGQQLYRQATRLIPGGTQLLSKRPELFLPEQWPSYYASARGVEVVDLDGHRYIDMSLMGVGACILGYADPDVDQAARDAINAGSMCTLNAPEEVRLAEELCSLHPWANMARFARSGGEAMAIAVRIARACTRRDKIAFCGYHGWSDWYLAANLGTKDHLAGHLMPGLEPLGVPDCLRDTSLPFHYNRIQELKSIVDRCGDELAAIVMEPRRGEEPVPGFLEEVRDLASSTGAVLIFDEITTGFRMTEGGIHLLLDVEPDVAVFAKALANGYAMAAVIGKADVMETCRSTFISSTNWTERIGPAAALATMEKFRRQRVHCHLQEIGRKVARGWRQAAKKAGLKLQIEGLPSLVHFSLQHPEELALTTLFTQLMLEKGYLAFNQFKPSFAHRDEHVESYLDAVETSFGVMVDALEKGRVYDLLKGPVAQRGFYRLAK